MAGGNDGPRSYVDEDGRKGWFFFDDCIVWAFRRWGGRSAGSVRGMRNCLVEMCGSVGQFIGCYE